jgi:tetratricopeptide (TPR) repeat protein
VRAKPAIPGRAAMSKPLSRENYAEAISLYERALALDPRSVEAQSMLAAALTARLLDQFSDSPAADIARAEGLAGQALAVSPRNPLAHYAKGQVLRAQQRFEEAIPEYATVLALNRNWVHAIAVLGYCKLFVTGSIEEMIPAQERAIRLRPRDPQIWLYYFWIGQAHLLQSRVDEAIVWFEKARSANPEGPLPHAYLASAYGLKGESGRAAAELAQVRRLSSDDRYTSIARLKAMGPWAPSFGGEWWLIEPSQQLYWFAEADDCSDDTPPRRRSISNSSLKAGLMNS